MSIKEEQIDFESMQDTLRLTTKAWDNHTITKTLKEIETHIFYKAIAIQSKSYNSLFRFNHIQDELEIMSMGDLLKSDFLGDFPLNFIMSTWKTFEDISNKLLLTIIGKLLDFVAIEIKNTSNPYLGTDFKLQKFTSEDWTKIKSIEKESYTSDLEKKLQGKKWYALDGFNGTGEEAHLTNFLIDTMWNLEKKYKEVYLLRNEETYKIYDFKTGRGFQPDFLLFLQEKWKDLYYQIFIEPKGTHLLEKDERKNKFLQEITKKYGENTLLKAENKDYILIGLPLYNKEKSQEFEEEYRKIVDS
jgi:type III restriction enzyme